MEKYVADQQQTICDCLIIERSCPLCQNTLLKEWELANRTLGLCFICGMVFWCENGEVIKQLSGNKKAWEREALLSVNSFY